MSWNYAEMSKAAKAAGGPEQYVATLVQSGRQEMYPWVLAASLATAVVTHYAPKAINFIKDKWVTKSDVQYARENIINGINQYNDEHPGPDKKDFHES